MKKRIVIFALIALLVMTTACGKKESGKTIIRFATWDSADNLEKQKAIVKEFNENNEKIEVKLEAYGDNYDTKITAAMGSKDAPDVMYMWNFPKYAKGLEPLEEFIKKEAAEFKADFYEALWNYNSFDGKIYALPVGYTTHVLYYNKDLFDKAGVEYPNKDWTYDDLVDAAKKISNESEKIYGFAVPIKPDPYDFEMHAWSNGGSYVDGEGNAKGVLNSDKNIEAFSLFQNMLKEKIALATEDSGAKDFALGKIAMFINGSWSLNSLKEKGVNFAVEALPKFGNNESKSILNSSGVAISSSSENKEAAFEFIKFYTGSKMNKKRADYEYPVLKSVVKELKLDENPINQKFYEMLEKSKDKMPASFISPNWTDLSDKISLALEKMFNMSSLTPVKEALDEASK